MDFDIIQTVRRQLDESLKSFFESKKMHPEHENMNRFMFGVYTGAYVENGIMPQEFPENRIVELLHLKFRCPVTLDLIRDIKLNYELFYSKPEAKRIIEKWRNKVAEKEDVFLH